MIYINKYFFNFELVNQILFKYNKTITEEITTTIATTIAISTTV